MLEDVLRGFRVVVFVRFEGSVAGGAAVGFEVADFGPAGFLGHRIRETPVGRVEERD